MFPSHSPQQTAIAAQLAVSLGAYERGLIALLQERWDPALYRSLSDDFDRMQMYANSLPGMSGAWTELLISRVELAQALWTLRTPARVDGKVVAMLANHRARIADVVSRCASFVPAGARERGTPTAPHR
jgi:hypothetical protein